MNLLVLVVARHGHLGHPCSATLAAADLRASPWALRGGFAAGFGGAALEGWKSHFLQFQWKNNLQTIWEYSGM